MGISYKTTFDRGGRGRFAIWMFCPHWIARRVRPLSLRCHLATAKPWSTCLTDKLSSDAEFDLFWNLLSTSWSIRSTSPLFRYSIQIFCCCRVEHHNIQMVSLSWFISFQHHHVSESLMGQMYPLYNAYFNARHKPTTVATDKIKSQPSIVR